MNCLSLEAIKRFIEGTLDDAVAEELERHLLECESCRKKLAEIESKTDDPFVQELRNAVVNTDLENADLLKYPQISGFQVIRRIGAGAHGNIFAAVDLETKEIRAIKILKSERTCEPSALKRFQREKEIVAKLNHPNIVKSFIQDDPHIIVMEFLQGKNLSDHVKENGPLSIEEASNIIVQAAKGLDFAHKNNIVHRDIKPSNLFLTADDEIKILDLGLSKILESADGSLQTLSSQIIGTPEFLSPEQIISPKTIDGRSDIYSLGCTFYFLLTGKSPFSGENVFSTLAGHAKDKIPSVRRLRPDISAPLAAVIEKMLEKSPERRFQTIQEVIEGIENPKPIRHVNFYFVALIIIFAFSSIFFVLINSSSDHRQEEIVVKELMEEPKEDKQIAEAPVEKEIDLPETQAVVPVVSPEINLVKNGSFEDGHESWRDDWQRQEITPSVQFGISSDARDGTVSATIESQTGGAGVWRQFVEIEPHATYRVSYWYKLDRVQPTERQDCGMEPCIAVGVYEPNSVSGYSWKGTDRPEGKVSLRSVKGSRDWTRFEQILVAGPSDSHVLIAFRFGALRNVTWYSSKGKIYIDNVKLVKIDER